MWLEGCFCLSTIGFCFKDIFKKMVTGIKVLIGSHLRSGMCCGKLLFDYLFFVCFDLGLGVC